MGIQRTAVVHLTRNDSSHSYGFIHPLSALGTEESEESEEDDDDSDEDDSDDDDDDNGDYDNDEEANSGEENGDNVTTYSTAQTGNAMIELIYQGMRYDFKLFLLQIN